MNCMKCGREIDEGKVFCIDCLKDMEKYPVRPGTAVHLPKRPAYSPIRRAMPKRKTLSPEEMVKKQRKIIRRLSMALTIASLLAALLAYPAVAYILDNDEFLIGQNYSVIQDLLPGVDDAE